MEHGGQTYVNVTAQTDKGIIWCLCRTPFGCFWLCKYICVVVCRVLVNESSFPFFLFCVLFIDTILQTFGQFHVETFSCNMVHQSKIYAYNSNLSKSQSSISPISVLQEIKKVCNFTQHDNYAAMLCVILRSFGKWNKKCVDKYLPSFHAKEVLLRHEEPRATWGYFEAGRPGQGHQIFDPKCYWPILENIHLWEYSIHFLTHHVMQFNPQTQHFYKNHQAYCIINKYPTCLLLFAPEVVNMTLTVDDWPWQEIV